MPIVDVQLVLAGTADVPAGAAAGLADAFAEVFQAPPGRVWVRVSHLAASAYAENGEPAASALPVFVRVLHADLPSPEALAIQAEHLALAAARVLKHPQEQVHVEYAPAGRGRIAFGGKLVR
jgi:phenylpyruvate tautomerase PptA (4-oxalocrotonate tautomerase family)